LPRVRVRTPDGTVWTVRRRWIPHREGKGVSQRFRNRRTKPELDGLDLPFSFASDLEGLAIVLGLIVVFVALLILGWPLLLLGIDLAWLAIVGVFGVIGRVVLRRPWRVEATSDTDRHDWYVQGFRAAGRLRDDLGNQYRHGHQPLPPTPTQLPH
jgi:hypothetical protein